MSKMDFSPSIDMIATGRKINKLRLANGYSVNDIQRIFGFEYPQSIYNWLKGKALPNVDHLYLLSALFDVTIDDILVGTRESERRLAELYFAEFEKAVYAKRQHYPAVPLICTILNNGRILVS